MTDPSDEEQAKARAALEIMVRANPRAAFDLLFFGSVEAEAVYDADGKFTELTIQPRRFR